MPSTFYVRKSGSDAANGQTPATAWQTIGHALSASPNGAGTNPSAGDTIYIGSGVYREQVTINGNSGSSGLPISVLGDVDGSKTGDPPGEIRWTAFDVNDKTVPTGSAATLNLNAKDYYTFGSLTLQGGKASGNIATSVGSIGITFQDTVFIAGTSAATVLISLTATVDTAAVWLIDRCRFLCTFNPSCVSLTLPTSTVADYDVNFVIQNSLLIGGSTQITIATSGANSFKPGGVHVRSCTLLGGINRCVQAASASLSTSIPCTVDNCLLLGNTGLQASTLGTLTETYNAIYCVTPRTSVNAGTGSISDGSYGCLADVGQSQIIGRPARPFMTPTGDSPLLAFGTLASPPSVDMLNRIRPSGGGPAWASANDATGCLERHDFGAQNTSTVPTGKSNSLQIAGPGDQEIQLPVTNVSTTISIQVNRDTNYGAGTKPTLELVAAPEIGVSGQSVADTGSASTWNTITLSAITPTANGVVKLRLKSFSAGNGNCYWGALAVA